MSATIHYRKVANEDPYLKHVWAPSTFIETLEAAFGRFPCVLGTAEVERLRGMAAVDSVNAKKDNPYLEIIEKIEQWGSIELYASY